MEENFVTCYGIQWVYSDLKIKINQEISAFGSHLTKGFMLLYIVENLLKTEFVLAEKLPLFSQQSVFKHLEEMIIFQQIKNLILSIAILSILACFLWRNAKKNCQKTSINPKRTITSTKVFKQA